MAYMNQEKKAIIKAAMDKALKARGFKYSLRVDNHMAIVCTIQAGPVDFIGNYCAKNYPSIQNTENNRALLREKQNMQVNLYWLAKYSRNAAKR